MPKISEKFPISREGKLLRPSSLRFCRFGPRSGPRRALPENRKFFDFGRQIQAQNFFGRHREWAPEPKFGLFRRDSKPNVVQGAARSETTCLPGSDDNFKLRSGFDQICGEITKIGVLGRKRRFLAV